jgi:hypothetical protein
MVIVAAGEDVAGGSDFGIIRGHVARSVIGTAFAGVDQSTSIVELHVLGEFEVDDVFDLLGFDEELFAFFGEFAVMKGDKDEVDAGVNKFLEFL